jgi:hypothetical protein
VRMHLQVLSVGASQNQQSCEVPVGVLVVFITRNS